MQLLRILTLFYAALAVLGAQPGARPTQADCDLSANSPVTSNSPVTASLHASASYAPCLSAARPARNFNHHLHLDAALAPTGVALTRTEDVACVATSSTIVVAAAKNFYTTSGTSPPA